MAYPDAHRYRVGANANQIPVNVAKCPVNHYQRDGKMAGTCPIGGGKIQILGVNFYPNSQINNGALAPDSTVAEPPMPIVSYVTSVVQAKMLTKKELLWQMKAITNKRKI